MKVQSWSRIQEMVNTVEAHSWPRRWQCMIDIGSRSSEGNHRGGFGFEGTSLNLFWPETLVYLLPGAELNQMLTLVVAIKSETPCEPELLLFAGMNDHLHAAGLLDHLKSEAPTAKKIWEAIQTLFAEINEVQESVVPRFGPNTKVAFTTSPGYASMPPALRFVYAMLILIAERIAWRILMAAPNRELEPITLDFLNRSWQRHGLMCLML